MIVTEQNSLFVITDQEAENWFMRQDSGFRRTVNKVVNMMVRVNPQNIRSVVQMDLIRSCMKHAGPTVDQSNPKIAYAIGHDRTTPATDDIENRETLNNESLCGL